MYWAVGAEEGRRLMRHHAAICLALVLLTASCAPGMTPTSPVLGPDAPYPPTWTPPIVPADTPTFTLVVKPTPTWDGTPPPPSTAEVPRLSAARLYRERDSGTILTVDVRNFAAYTQAHIPDAVHMPLEELPARISELDGSQTIVLYDLSQNQSLSLKGAMYLYEVGFTKVAVLDGGLQKWYADGYPIEGTLLTPTPGPVGPPWAVTPLVTMTLTVTGTAAPIAGTPVATLETGTSSPTAPEATLSLTPTLTTAP
jgi:rhodanese-related sulfurtransferase